MRGVGSIRRRTALVPLAFVLLIACSAGGVVWYGNASSVPDEARDFDCDGTVTLREWFAAAGDYGWRESLSSPGECMEVFAYKDGLPVVLHCAAEPRCRVPNIGGP